MRRSRCAVVLLTVAAALAACSGDDGTSAPVTTAPPTVSSSVPSSGSTSVPPTTLPPTTLLPTTTLPTTTLPSTTLPTTTLPTTTLPSTTTTTVCPGPAFARTPRADDTVPPAAALLTAVRAAAHDCYDRVVFEFRGPALPEWRVEPAEPPFSGPSGIPVDVRGTSWLHVRFATANAHTDDGEATVGVEAVPLGDTTVLRQVQIIEDFEAIVVYVIGMDGPRPFRVLTFTAPPRLAIDVRTG